MRFDCLREFVHDRTGAVAPVYAIAIPTLVAIAGVGFDYSRMASLDTELQNAADQAALAGATQLDGKALSGTTPGACTRAAGAVVSFVANNTRFANDGEDPLVTFQNEAGCDASGSIRFWQDKEKTTAATNDANAKFIEVVTDVRVARYALTPIVGAINPSMQAAAMAGLGSSICKVPPLMLCSPDPTVKFDPDSYKGLGVVATGHSTGSSGQANGGNNTNNTWAPGDFGFLQVANDTNSNSRNDRLLKALAYDTPPTDCVPLDDNKVSTGNPQNLYDAINTRFDIYDFNDSGGGNVLAPCRGGACSSAPNVVKDMTNSAKSPIGTNDCKVRTGKGGSGWAFPDAGREFKPETKAGSTNATLFDDNGVIDVMGLPRDNCHYTSYNGTGMCGGGTGRFGNGLWDRADYFKTNHTSSGVTDYPPNWQNITRYETYLWELNNSKVPDGTSATSQRGKPMCFSGTPGKRDRRVLTVAIVSNCSALSGASTKVQIDEFADVFLVEPSSDNAIRYNAFKDAVYIEIIGKSKIGGSGTYSNQQVRRDVPYLVR